MCVSLRHGLVIVSNQDTRRLWVYSLVDGSLVCKIGYGEDDNEGFLGGLCVSPDGDCVLATDWIGSRLRQIRIADGSRVRFIGVGVLERPQYVDCNDDAIVVAEWCNSSISVFSWGSGGLRSRFGRYGNGPGKLRDPCGVRLLADGSGLVVSDSGNHRLCVFRLSGEFVAVVGSEECGLSHPLDVLECVPGGSFLVANYYNHEVVKFSRDGSTLEVVGKSYLDGGHVAFPMTLATLSDGGVMVLDCDGTRLQKFPGMKLRFEWVVACVTLSARECHAGDVAIKLPRC